MQQLLHALIVDSSRGEALVTQHGPRWLLPIVHAPERVRAAPLLSRWATELGLAGNLVGQWLGRRSSNANAIDWLAIVDASIVESVVQTKELQWTPLQLLRSSSSWIEYQQWAVTKALTTGALPAVGGPFGVTTWMSDALNWLANVTGAPDLHSRHRIVPHRVTAYEVVLELRTARGVLYFKGLSGDHASEAMVTTTLAAIAPESFPRTIALETRPDGTVWWLMTACPGLPLAACPNADRAAHVAASYARLQQQIMTSTDVDRIGVPALEWDAIAGWAIDCCNESDAVQKLIDDARSDVRSAWMMADFDPANVILSAHGVRFIDLDGSRLASAPLGVSTFVRRLARLGLSCGDAVRESYERAWSPRLALNERWRLFDSVSRLVECYFDWLRLETRTRRGEIHDLLEPARHRVAERVVRIAASAER